MHDDTSSTYLIGKWQDIANDGNLDNFAKLNNIKSDIIKLINIEATILPNNLIMPDLSCRYNLFSQISKNVLKALKDGGMETQIYDDGKDKRELILDSADIIFPILLFLGSTAASVGLNVLSNWIYAKWVENQTTKTPSIKVEYLEISNSGEIIKWRKIEGPANEMQRLLLEESNRLTKNDGEQNEPSNVKNNIENSWWDAYCDKEAKEAIKKANELIQEANDSIKLNNRKISEKYLRESLVKFREAVLWKPDVEEYRIYLHDIGRKIHEIYGCELEFKDNNYWVACPVFLSHSECGFSVGGSGKAVCSICKENIFDCDHIKGEVYNNVVARKFHDLCNICGKNGCEHAEGKEYNGVHAFAVVTEFNVDHIAIVQNPANPLCVIHKYSLQKSDLIEMIPEDERNQFVYGETIVSCHHCLICKGVKNKNNL